LTVHEDGIRYARLRASAVVRRFGIRAPHHISVEAIARGFGVTLVEAPLDGAIAQLVRNGNRAYILLSERVTDSGARRFSIAHELGHLDLGHPSCAPSDLAVRSCSRLEAEANAYGAELLMPRELVFRDCQASPVALDAIMAIASTYRVSILAAAIRFTELTTRSCAAVFSRHERVKWVARSATFKHDIPRDATLASVRAFIGSSPRSEHAVSHPDHGTTLTIFCLPKD
jgi:Zn-dependent peptidase ImmA (M78 family)